MRFVLLLAATLWTAHLARASEFATSIIGAFSDVVSAMTTDASGNTYVVGTRLRANGSGVFVTKLDQDGKIVFERIFGGSGIDTGVAIAVDHGGNIHIGGTTTSADFPLTHALQSQMYTGGPVNGVPAGSGYLIKLSGDGKTVLYSTYFGGAQGQSAITALATDGNNNLYLTGYTQAADFPHTEGMPFGTIAQQPATPGAILASIAASGERILYSGVIAMATPCATTCISNGPSWEGVGIAVDAAGNAYVAGNDFSSTSLPTTAGVLSPTGIGAFVAKVKAGGSGLGYLTYLGAGAIGNSPFLTAANTLSAIAVDALGNVYLAGRTFDAKFPATAGAYLATPSSPNKTDGFAAKLNPAGSAMVWATFLGDAGPQSIALDATQNVWISGTAGVAAFPNTNGFLAGPEFLARLNAAGSKLTYSALAPLGTTGQSVAVEESGIVHVAGSAGFVVTIAPAEVPRARIFSLQNGAGGNVTARISPAEVITIYGPGIGPQAPETAQPPGGVYSTGLGGVEVVLNGVKLPLLYASANQINAVAPMNLAAEAAAEIRVIHQGIAGPSYPLFVADSAPRAFAPVVNQDGTINSQSNPAALGSSVKFFVTGSQADFFPLADGEVATSTQDQCFGRCSAMAATYAGPIGGGGVSVATAVVYGGTAPGFIAGVTQFEIRFESAVLTATTILNVSVKDFKGETISQSVWIRP